MMHHFNPTRMLHYNAIITSVELIKFMGIFVFELKKINKHFILLPENDGVEEYISPFREI